jgi:hypothetical protein
MCLSFKKRHFQHVGLICRKFSQSLLDNSLFNFALQMFGRVGTFVSLLGQGIKVENDLLVFPKMVDPQVA